MGLATTISPSNDSQFRIESRNLVPAIFVSENKILVQASMR